MWSGWTAPSFPPGRQGRASARQLPFSTAANCASSPAPSLFPPIRTISAEPTGLPGPDILSLCYPSSLAHLHLKKDQSLYSVGQINLSDGRLLVVGDWGGSRGKYSYHQMSDSHETTSRVHSLCSYYRRKEMMIFARGSRCGSQS